ncbi:hypothetical protein QBC44DRAFT_320686 [Cladorrhinum sp. PSN332]|nr:hypothetical protein QBC44DRAFT_320686 [Cladorrhinum sp. PSN332]
MPYRPRRQIAEQSWQQQLPLLPPIQDPPDAALQAIHRFETDTRATTKTFACPFSKRNLSEPANIWCRPMRTEDWTTVSGIVEHICSRHHPPISESSLCTPLPFGALGILNNLDDAFSPPYIPATIPLINGQQWKRVRSLSFWGPETSKWYKIWDILFPDWPRPPSPFLNDENDNDHRSETLSACAVPRATPTDSGYASAPALFDLHTSVQDKGNTKTEDDTQTIYSTVTTVIPNTVRESILQVCETIHDRVKPNLNPHDFKTDSTWMPWIIKVFAVELGMEDSTSGATNRGIMHFVHKHHEQIGTQLRRIFHNPETDNDTGSRNHERSGMSLADKMSLWGKKSDEVQETDYGECDLFVGVEEDEEDGNEPSHLPSAFAKEILQSRAYTALIDRILRELSLHRADTECFPETQSIRETILSRFPTGTISKSRPPQVYTATFNLPWGRQDGASESSAAGPTCRISPEEDLGKRIVLVLSASDRIQATTVQKYLEQTWPLDATQVLRLLHETLGANTGPEPQSSAFTSLHQTGIRVAFSLSGLVMHVCGPPHFIAERGEMLGWLVAAVQSETLSGVQSTPLIYSTTEDAVPDRNSRQTWTFSIQQERLATNPTTSLVEKIQKYAYAQGFPVAAVKGYPTRHRPDDYPGVEIAPKLFADVIWSALSESMRSLVLEGMGCTLPQTKSAFPPGSGLTSLIDLNAGLFLRGNDPRSFPPALKLLKKKGTIMFWHAPLSAPACRCPRQLELALDNGQWPRRTTQDIQAYRHIISVCQPRNTVGGSDTVRANSPSTETQLSLDDDKTAPLDSFARTDSPVLPRAVSSQTAGSSLDSEAFSMSESSTDVLAQDPPPGSYLSSMIDRFTSDLLRVFQDFRNGFVTRGPSDRAPPNGNHANTDQPSSSSNPNYLSIIGRLQQRRSKRPVEETEEEDEEGDEQRRQKKRRKLGEPEEPSSRRLLACPFWKMDPTEHRPCFKMTLHGISRVKQHLTRKHLPAFYCERCMLVLPDERTHLAHIQIMNCSFQSEKFNGITHRQQRELSKKSNPSLSVTEQWFAIWGIVFPNTPRPLSAYMDPDLSEDLCRFREFAELHGPGLIAEEIRSSQSEGAEPEIQGLPDVALRHVISQGLNRIFENWLRDRPRNNSQATVMSTRLLSSHGQDTFENSYTFQQVSRGSMSSNPDSGVAMQGSQRSRDRDRPRGYQPAVTSWPASFHTYTLAGVGLGADGLRGDDVPPPPIPITITEDPLSPRADAVSAGQGTGLLPDTDWEKYFNDLFPGGSGLT